MKKLLVFALFVVAALMGYNYMTTGKLTLIPGGGSSPEKEQLQALRSEFQSLRQEYSQAARAAGIGGVDTSASVEGVMEGIEVLNKKVDQFLSTVKDAGVRDNAQKLKDEVVQFKRSLGM